MIEEYHNNIKEVKNIIRKLNEEQINEEKASKLHKKGLKIIKNTKNSLDIGEGTIKLLESNKKVKKDEI